MQLNRRNKTIILVGDNPFHNISHLSQDRTRARGTTVDTPELCANLVLTSIENGANGFMFSVSKMTLSILEALRREGQNEDLTLYAIVPYAYEYVKLATQVGGISGLAKELAKEMIVSRDLRAMAIGFKGMLRIDPILLMKTYLTYEVNRIRRSAGRQARVESILLHEIVTDVALALNLDWLFKAYVSFISKLGATPGFNTCNFAYLINKLRDWNIDLRDIVIASPFNKVGFQMNPSRIECERMLADLQKPNLIAISIMAAGYLMPREAIDYIASLPNIKGVAAGISSEAQSCETFRLLRDTLHH